MFCASIAAYLNKAFPIFKWVVIPDNSIKGIGTKVPGEFEVLCRTHAAGAQEKYDRYLGITFDGSDFAGESEEVQLKLINQKVLPLIKQIS